MSDQREAGFWLTDDEMENLDNLLSICADYFDVPQEGSDRAEGFVSDYEAQTATQENVRRLRALLDRLTYKPEWTFSIIGHAGWHAALQIRLNTPDSNVPPGAGMTVLMLIDHQFQVPYFPLDDMERWLLDCIVLVERHEACEHFRLDGRAPFYPEHGEGADPYRLRRLEVAHG